MIRSSEPLNFPASDPDPVNIYNNISDVQVNDEK